MKKKDQKVANSKGVTMIPVFLLVSYQMIVACDGSWERTGRLRFFKDLDSFDKEAKRRKWLPVRSTIGFRWFPKPSLVKAKVPESDYNEFLAGKKSLKASCVQIENS